MRRHSATHNVGSFGRSEKLIMEEAMKGGACAALCGTRGEAYNRKCQVCGESVTLLDQEEHWRPEEHLAFSLQCGDSLAIAANRIMEEDFGVKRLLRALSIV